MDNIYKMKEKTLSDEIFILSNLKEEGKLYVWKEERGNFLSPKSVKQSIKRLKEELFKVNNNEQNINFHQTYRIIDKIFGDKLV